MVWRKGDSMSKNTNDEDQKRLFSEDYRIDGTNMFNLSKWSRENIPKPPHKYKVGDIVTVTVTAEITELHHDCDGTALYKLDGHGTGYTLDDSYARPATKDEIDNY